jgi:hypothetical protein
MRFLLVLSLLCASCAWAAQGQTKLYLTVPSVVADAAQARLAGNTKAPPPILILEGLEVGKGEGFTFRVLGPTGDKSASLPVLAVTGVVGHKQRVPEAPVKKMKLVVPLNDRAAAILAGKTDVTLTLELENDLGRPALKIEKAFFSTSAEDR